MNKDVPCQVDHLLALLDPSRIRILRHDALGMPIRSVADFANAMGVKVDRIAKTVVIAKVVSPPEKRIAEPSPSFALVCLPGSRKINASAVVQHLDWSGCQLAKPFELREVCGFEPGAVSPLWLGEIPLIVDQTLLSFATIFVGSGTIGIDIELDPRDLVRLTKARVGNIARD